MTIQYHHMMFVALCGMVIQLEGGGGSAASSSTGVDASRTTTVLFAGNTIETGANVDVDVIASGEQGGSAQGISSSAEQQQKYTADIPMGPGGAGAGGLEAGLGGFAGGLAGEELNSEGREGGRYRGGEPEMVFGAPSAASSRKHTDDPNNEDLASLLNQVDITSDVKTGSMQTFDTKKITFKPITLDELMQVTLPEYSTSQIKEKISAGPALLQGYMIKPTEGKAFDAYKKLGKKLSIKVLVTVQKARQETLNGLNNVGKGVSPINNKPLVEIIIYRQTPREAKNSEWKEIISLVQNIYDGNLGALFKVNTKAWLSLYISKVGRPTTLANVGVAASLPFAIPNTFKFEPLKDGGWDNKVKTTAIEDYNVAGYQFNNQKILLVGKRQSLWVYVERSGTWKKIAQRGPKFINNPLGSAGYYVQIQNQANNGFLNLYDTAKPDFIYMLATHELVGKNLTKIS